MEENSQTVVDDTAERSVESCGSRNSFIQVTLLRFDLFLYKIFFIFDDESVANLELS